jgi:S1-C subfamily serine protease
MMRTWLAPLIGLPLGLALAGLGILWLAPVIERLDRGRLLAELALAAVPAPTPAGAIPAAASLPHAVASPTRSLRPGPAPHAAAPHAVPPAAPELLRPPPGATSQASGTGFFVSLRGTLLTAAHVVRDCRAIRIASRLVPPTSASLVAVDAEHDIALLHAPNVAVPGRLAVAPPSAGAQTLFVLGYPSGASHDAPDETWAHLANHDIAATNALERHPGSLLWLQARAIAQGYSGGPVVDPHSGHAVGIVRALIDARKAEAIYGIDLPDLSVGPGALPLRAVLSREPIRDGFVPASLAGPPALEQARRATVHVFCWS